MADVILTNVHKVYEGGVTAVRDFNLHVRHGEFVVLVGPSGCGKSTTLRMVAGLEEISRGTIQIGDRIVNDIPPKDRDIAMVFQNYALYPHMTVRENLAFGMKLRKFPKAEIEISVNEAAKILGLAEYLDRKPKALSGGQRQRVAVGRAIVRKPAVFLFDEPLSNLDAKMRVQMRVELSRLHQHLGATMIYVTHDQTEAMTMGERIVVMKDGIIQQVADPMTLYTCPANRFVAGFVGTPAMNFMDGRIDDKGGKLAFITSRGIVIPVSARQQAILQAYKGKNVTLGVRPENIGSPLAEQTPKVPRMKAIVEVIEPMGAETYVHMRAGDMVFVCRTDTVHNFKVGDTASPAINIDKVHFFDSVTEQTID